MKEFLDERISENMDLKIVKGMSAMPIIRISRRSAGKNREEAAANAQKIDYHYDVQDSVVYLDDYFSMGTQQLWRNQKVLVTIEVPEGFKLYIDRSCDRILNSDFTRHHNRYDNHDNDELTGKYLKVDKDGITVPVNRENTN
jgi:hypothetical protein